MTLDVQFLTMIAMIAGGFWLGMALDTFRRLSVYWRERVSLVYIMEISFWLTQTLLLYDLLFLVNNGELRLYVLIALLLGFATYKALAARLYKRILEYVIAVIIKIYRMAAHVIRAIIVTPIQFIIRLLLTVLVFMAQWLWYLLVYSLKIIWMPVFWLFRLMFRMLPLTVQRKLHKMAGFYSTIKKRCKNWIHHVTSKRR